MWERFKALRRISELEERVAGCERHLKAVQLDYDDLYDRMKRLSGRVAKRDEREQAAEDRAPIARGEDLTATSVLSPGFSKLTPRQRQIQYQIMQRRANGGANT